MPINNDLNDRNTHQSEQFSGRTSFDSSPKEDRNSFSNVNPGINQNYYEDDDRAKWLPKVLFGSFVVGLLLYVGGFSFFGNYNTTVVADGNAIQIDFQEEEITRLQEELSRTLGENGEVNMAIQEALQEAQEALRDAQIDLAEEQERSGVIANLAEGFRDGVNEARYSDELLDGMGSWMEEMGYTGLTKDDLIDLREKGVTATYTNGIRELGYNATLDDIVRLKQNDVSTRFAAMMQSLGYELSIDDMIRLRRSDVTAFYTSNLHDMGYRNITSDELIRFKQVGVSTNDIKRLIANNNRTEKPTIEEILRYKISNQ